MGRSITINGLVIDVHISPCAHICRYCSIGDREFSSIPASRLIALYDRFLQWKALKGFEDFGVQWDFLGPSYNFDLETLTELMDHSERTTGFRWRRIPLGGLRMLPEKEMRKWLKARQALGYDSVAASMAGHGPVHDRWNGRQGDFEFMVGTQKIAAELGMELHQGFFLAKSTLPILDETRELLDARLGPPTKRYARQFMSAGYGSYHEDERITEEDRERLPGWVLDIFKRDSGEYLRSEREWIEIIRGQERPVQKTYLHLRVNEQNIDEIEGKPCDEIFNDLEQRTIAVFGAMPSVAELMERVGDANGTKLYPSAFDLQRVWMDRYFERCPLDIDWSLAPHHVGKMSSRHPPRLAPLA